jgi:dihydroxyacetone kinase-like protein
MQRILNNPDYIVDEMLAGYLKAHKDLVSATDNPRVVKTASLPENKVGLVTGGGPRTTGPDP